MRAYVIAYGGRTSPLGQVERLMTRAREYLTSERAIDASRFTVVNGGFREEDSVELWIVPSGAAAPKATPTVQVGDVNPRRVVAKETELCTSCFVLCQLSLNQGSLAKYKAPGSRVYKRPLCLVPLCFTLPTKTPSSN
jgi:hypothetical protein